MKNLGQVYNDVGVESDVMSASGHRLIQLMLDKCLQHIELSKIFIQANDIPKKSQSISKALDITDYLRLCLNHNDESAKKLSGLLDALYSYLQRHLVQANIKNDVESLDEAKKVLAEVKEGWDGIA